MGLLAALAIPRLSGSRDNASRKTVLADLRTIESALSIAQAEGKTVTSLAANGDATSLVALGYLATEPLGPTGVTYSIGGTPLRAQATLASDNLFGTTTTAAGSPYTIEDLSPTW